MLTFDQAEKIFRQMKDIVFHFCFLKMNIYQVTKKMRKATKRKVQPTNKTNKNVRLGSGKSQCLATGLLTDCTASRSAIGSGLRTQIPVFFYSMNLWVFRVRSVFLNRFSSLSTKGQNFRSKIIVISRT